MATLAERYDRLSRDSAGNPLITLMVDPKMTDPDGNPVGFLSLVDRGANQRRFAVAKRDAGDALPDSAFLLVEKLGREIAVRSADGKVDPQGVAYAFVALGERKDLDAAVREEGLAEVRKLWAEVAGAAPATAAGVSKARTILEPLVALGFLEAVKDDGTIVVSKASVSRTWDALTFDAAVAVADVEARFDAALGALARVFRNVVSYGMDVGDEDPVRILRSALAALGLFAGIPVAKRGEVAVEVARKEGRTLSRANRAKVRDLEKRVAELSATLKDFIDGAGPDPDDDTEEDEMDAQKRIELAVKAAMDAARAAGITDPAGLADVAVKASAEAAAKIAGPTQPAVPDAALADQFRGKWDFGGMGDPAKALTSAISNIEKLTKKVAELEALVSGTPAAKVDGKDVEAVPGIVDVVNKHSETLEVVVSKVASRPGATPAPRAGEGHGGANLGDRGEGGERANKRAPVDLGPALSLPRVGGKK